jgi:hypothetical protein
VYTPILDGEEQTPVFVHLDPKYEYDPEDFEEGDIFIFVITEAGDKESVLVRPENNTLLAVIQGSTGAPDVYIPMETLYIDTEASSIAQEVLDEERNRAAREQGSKDRLFRAIPWAEYGHQYYEGIEELTLSITVALERDDGEWVVRRATQTEEQPISNVERISGWVLGIAVFVALALNLILLAVFGKD